MTATSLIHSGLGLLRAAAGLVWNPACIACSSNEATYVTLCEHCSREMLLLAGSNYCPCCGASLGPNVPQARETCPSCPKHAFKFEQIIRLGAYAGPLKMAIRRLKYHPAAGGWQALADMLAQAVLARCGGAGLDVIVPVPMYWTRRLLRGKNQSALLAGALASGLELPVGGELVRIRNTPPQVHLPASSRAKNVRGAFAVRGGAALAGAHVLLVDDVSTTGATANESARTLLSAGAARVTLAVLAKADPPKAYSHELVTGQA